MRYSGIRPLENERYISASLQAGVLKGHGREFSAYMFISLNSEAAIEYVGSLRPQSAYDQFQAIKYFHDTGDTSSHFIAISISATGLRKIGVTDSDLPKDLAFRSGMKRARIGDPPSPSWEPFFRNEVDLLIILAADNEQQLRSLVEAHLQAAVAVNAVSEHHVVWGYNRRNTAGYPIEAFGFSDGISHPLFTTDDIQSYAEGAEVEDYDPSFDPRDLIIFEYPARSGAFGTYTVFRKIEQMVAVFRSEVGRLSAHLGISEDEVAAQAMGRHPDGTPLVLSPTEDPSSTENNFNYSSDISGKKCPLHAHIRKMNTRGTSLEDPFHTILRRGVYYRDDDLELEGLMFVCHQLDIGRQFEFLQSRWANDARFPGNQSVGLDPIIGRSSVNDVGQRWNREWGKSLSHVSDPFQQCTLLRGGEYMFTPPVQFFASLRE